MSRLNKISDDSSTVSIESPSDEDKGIFASKSKKQLCMEMLKPFIAEETQLVKGRFRNHETPGGSATIQMLKYPGIPQFKKIMQDNEVYEIPLYVARFLNGVDVLAKACGEKIHTCSYAIHGFNWANGAPMPKGNEDDRGIPVPIINVAKRVRRYGFESMEFDKAM